MKKLTSRIASALLIVCMVLTVIPAMPAQALTAQSVVSKTVSSAKFKKVSYSSSANAYIASASSGKYTAIVKGTPASDQYDIDHMKKLYVTSGTSERVVNLEKLIKDKYSLDSTCTIEFYQLTAIKGKFYITGACSKDDMLGAENSSTKYFLISTTSGKTVTVKTIKKPLTSIWCCYDYKGWDLYYFKDNYVAIPKCNPGIRNSSTGSSSFSYYKSSDLSSWTAVKMKPSTYSINLASKRKGTINMHLANVTSKAIYYIEEVNGGPCCDYGYAPTVHYMYTTDHTSFKAVTTLNDTITTNGNKMNYDDEVYENFTRTLHLTGYGTGKTFATTDVQKANSSGFYNTIGFKAYTSSTLNGFKQVISFDKKWSYMLSMSTTETKYTQVFVKTASAKYMYRINGETATATKYSSTIDCEKIGGICCKNGYTITTYAGKYLLVTKNGGAKFYKINTGKSNLKDVSIAGDYLVLAGSKGYDYYVPFNTITAACK